MTSITENSVILYSLPRRSEEHEEKVSSQKFGVGARLALAQLGDRKGAPLHFEMILFLP